MHKSYKFHQYPDKIKFAKFGTLGESEIPQNGPINVKFGMAKGPLVPYTLPSFTIINAIHHPKITH